MIRVDHTPAPEPEEDIVVPVGDYRIQVVGSGLSPGIDHHQGDLLTTVDGQMMIIDSSGVPREVRPHNYGSGVSSYQRSFESPFVTTEIRPASITPPRPEGTVSQWFTRIMDLF